MIFKLPNLRIGTKKIHPCWCSVGNVGMNPGFGPQGNHQLDSLEGSFHVCRFRTDRKHRNSSTFLPLRCMAARESRTSRLNTASLRTSGRNLSVTHIHPLPGKGSQMAAPNMFGSSQQPETAGRRKRLTICTFPKVGVLGS